MPKAKKQIPFTDAEGNAFIARMLDVFDARCYYATPSPYPVDDADIVIYDGKERLGTTVLLHNSEYIYYWTGPYLYGQATKEWGKGWMCAGAWSHLMQVGNVHHRFTRNRNDWFGYAVPVCDKPLHTNLPESESGHENPITGS